MATAPPPLPSNSYAVAVTLANVAGGFELQAIGVDGSSRVTLAQSTDRLRYSTYLNCRAIYVRTSPTSEEQIYSVAFDGSGTVALTSADESDSPVGVTGSRLLIYRRIIGAAESDLYALNTDGTGATALGLDSTFAGIVSGRVVYKSDLTSELYSVEADGTDNTTLDAGDFVGSAGSIVLYLKTDGLYAINVDGTGKVPLALITGTESVQLEGIASDRVIYHRYSANGTRLYSVGIDGSGTVELDTSGNNVEFGEVAGSRVVYTRAISAGRADLYSVNADGTNSLALAVSDDYKYPAGFVGGQVIYERGTDGGAFHLYAVSPDGSMSVPLSPAAITTGFAGAIGNRVIYQAFGQPFDMSQRDLYSVNVDGSGTVGLATSSDTELFLATAGNRVIYSRASTAAGKVQLLSVDIDGTGAVELAAAPSALPLDGIITESSACTMPRR